MVGREGFCFENYLVIGLILLRIFFELSVGGIKREVEVLFLKFDNLMEELI